METSAAELTIASVKSSKPLQKVSTRMVGQFAGCFRRRREKDNKGRNKSTQTPQHLLAEPWSALLTLSMKKEPAGHTVCSYSNSPGYCTQGGPEVQTLAHWRHAKLCTFCQFSPLLRFPVWFRRGLKALFNTRTRPTNHKPSSRLGMAIPSKVQRSLTLA